MERQSITLRNNIAAEWLEVQGKAGAPSWVLSFKDGNTDINMSTRGTKAQTVNIANSFVPLKSSSPSLLPPEIVSAQQLYPPVSSGVLICTNYFNAPTWNVMVMAGSNPATPHKGEFIVESGSLSKTISLPSGVGIPTLADFSRTSVTFTTSTGASGTLNYRTGTLNMNH